MEINNEKINLFGTFIKIKKQYKIKFIFKFLNKSKFIFLFLFSYYLFFLSLEKCFEGWDECCIKVFWIKRKLIQAVLSSFLISLLLELIILNILSKYNLIHIFIALIIFYQYSHGKDFNDHGYYNLIGSFIIILINFVGLIPLNIFIYLSNNKIHIFKFILFLLIFIYFNIIFFNKNNINCEDWVKGLNNTSIENNINKYGCQIIFPKLCPYKIGKYFLDITKLKGLKCNNINKSSRKKILEISKSPFLSNKSLHVGYPLTNKDSICFLDFNDNDNILKNYFLNNLVDMDDKKLLKKYFKNKIPEIEIDFNENLHGNIKINLKFNKTLSLERKIKEKYSSPYSDNIIILYIDSVSRANSLRQLKKTLRFFEKFMNYKGDFNRKYPSENYHSFQFFKYHSFLYHTRGNYPILFYGKKREQKNKISITKYLKEKGFIACFLNDFCMIDNVRTFHNFSKEEVYDHQFVICDPNIDHYNQNSIKCLYGKSNAEILYEYGNQFWRKYRNNRKYLAIIINDGHEGTLEALKYVDETIFNFINNLYNDNLLKDSSIFLLSDHGVGMPSMYYFFKFYKLEEQLPMLYIIINDRKNISYNNQYKYIYENQQTFITGYDIYNTIIHIIYGEDFFSLKNIYYNKHSPKSNLGESLFNKINQKLRSPNSYDNISYFACQ